MKTIITLLFMVVIFAYPTFAQTEQNEKPADLAEKTKVYPCPARSTEQVNVLLPQGVGVTSIYLVKIDGWIPGGWLVPPQSQQNLNLLLPKLSSGNYVLKFSLVNGRSFSKKIPIIQ